MILHLDLDCFFAAAHRIGTDKYDNIPIAVGGRSNLSIFDIKTSKRELSAINGAFTSAILSSHSDKTYEEYFVDPDGKVRGIVITSSYEARAFGVKTAMPLAEALRWCPSLTVLLPNYPLYHELSHKLKLLLEKAIPSIEQFSVDEFFGDVTGWIEDKDVYDFAIKLKQQIKDELKLPISIGIAQTKWIAKIATNKAKPFGVKLVVPEEVEAFIKNLPIQAFPGIGKGYAQRLQDKGITTLGEIKRRKELFYSWGKMGIQLYNRINGYDHEKISLAQSRKSIGLARTFDPHIDRDEIRRRITILSRHLSFLAYKGKHNPLTFSLNVSYQYGEKQKCHVNNNRPFNEQHLKQEMVSMFDKIDLHKAQPIIQLSLTLSNFKEDKVMTMDLLNYEEDTQQAKLTASMQKLRDKFGIDIIKSGGEL